MTEEVTQVLLLSDEPAEKLEDTIHGTAVLIESAIAGKLVAVVCRHLETLENHTILCALEEDEDAGTAQYVPLGMLFTKGNTPWQEYAPPQVATIPNNESRQTH